MANSDIAKYSPPTDYPKNILPKDGLLKPIKLTFDVLNAVKEIWLLNARIRRMD